MNAESGRPTTAASRSMAIGIVMEKRSARSRWTEETWRTAAVFLGGGWVEAGSVIDSGADWTRYYGGCLELTLHRSGTAGYRQTLSAPAPQLYVVLRPRDDERAVEPFLVTACPFEAQDYLDSGEETVDAVPMPPSVAAWVQAFVDRHHVDEPFVKRKQKPKSGSSSRRSRYGR